MSWIAFYFSLKGLVVILRFRDLVSDTTKLQYQSEKELLNEMDAAYSSYVMRTANK